MIAARIVPAVPWRHVDYSPVTIPGPVTVVVSGTIIPRISVGIISVRVVAVSIPVWNADPD